MINERSTNWKIVKREKIYYISDVWQRKWWIIEKRDYKYQHWLEGSCHQKVKSVTFKEIFKDKKIKIKESFP